MNIYKKAMAKFNDDFYTAVSSKYNLERKSQTARPRVAGTTEEYKQAIKQLEQLKIKNQNLEKRILKAKEKGYKAGIEEFKQKNIITKFNVLNVTKKEQQQKDAELAIKYRKKIDEQKEELELKEKEKIEIELENQKLKKKNLSLNNKKKLKHKN